MKTKIYILLLVVGAFILTSCGLIFNSVSDEHLSYIEIKSMAIDKDDNIYVIGSPNYFSFESSLFKSIDNGENWEKINLPDSGTEKPNLKFVNAGLNGIILLGTWDQKIYKSTDMGKNWVKRYPAISNNLSSYAINFSSFLINPDRLVIAGSYTNGVFVSTDWGDSWEHKSTDSLKVYCLLNYKGYIYAGSEKGMIFRSQDTAKTWTPLNVNRKRESVHNIVADSRGNLYAATFADDLYKSTNNGETWNELDISGDVKNLIIDSDDNIYVGTNGDGILKSVDNGMNWTEINTGLENENVTAISVNSKDYVFAGTSYGIYRSLDKGKNWTLTNNLINIPEQTKSDSTRFGIQILPREKEIAFGGGFENTFGLYRIMLPFFSTVIVYKDSNNNNKLSASYTSLFTLAALFAGSVMHPEDVGEARNTMLYILIVPVVIANSEHHLMLVPASESNPFETSFYINSRADIFEHWWRYVAGGGIQIGFNLGKNNNPYGGKGFGLQFGFEKAFMGSGIYNRDWVVYGGLRYSIHF